MSVFIQLKNLSYCYPFYNEKCCRTIDNVNLSINSGEFVAIIGTNGSGKSTLARHFNALLVPTEGSCHINGLDTRKKRNIWKIRQIVGMVFQNPDNQLVNSVVEEDIAFGPENLGISSEIINKRVNNALELVNMKEYRYHNPDLLSGGQKQKIAIAGILAMEPKCMVLDEPTAMLDSFGRKEILKIINNLNRCKGITIIFVTHFINEILNADRVIVLNNGKIVEDNIPSKIFSQTEKLRLLGLDAPIAAKIAYSLRNKGINLSQHIFTDKELMEEICQLY